MMGAVGLIVHLGRESACAHAKDLAGWLAAEGHVVKVPPDDAAAAGLDRYRVEVAEFAEELDLVVTLGGDGSILRAVELLDGAQVPLLGVDHGQLGYLTEVEPAEAQHAVARALTGDYEVEDRMLLRTTVVPASGAAPTSLLAMNEAVVERASEANTIRLAVHLDEEFFTTYAADGLIVATPTGSTAYAFSARGPIIEPTHRALLLTPVSPHMLFDRSLVLEPSTRVRLIVDGHRPATVSVDGRRITVLVDGDVIECVVAEESARLVTFGPRRFHRVLKAKFGLNDR